MTMNVPKLDAHRSTLYLTFGPKCPAYAELAAFKNVKSSYKLKVGLDINLLKTNATLTIPPGLDHAKTTLTGKRTILRYFAALNPVEPLVALKTDEQLHALHSGSAKPWTVSTPTIADYFAWDLSLTAPSEASTAIGSQMASRAECIQSKAEIDKLVSLAPLFDVYRYNIAEKMSRLTGIDAQSIIEMLSPPRDKASGDMGLPVPRLKMAGNPADIATELASKFPLDNYIVKAEGSGAFIYFSYNKIHYHAALRNVIRQGKEYGTNSYGFGQLAIVEYSSPNIAKPFHAGHLRSTIIGSFIEKALNACGLSTLSINYLGDWGKQYGLLAVGFEKYGSQSELQADPIRHLYEVYVKINKDATDDETIHDSARQYFKRMEDGDEEALKLWKEFRDLSIVAYKKIYARLNVSFDIYSGESQYSFSQMKSVLDELESNGLLTPDKGASSIVDLEPYKLGTAVICKSDGSMLYLSRDIAAAIDRRAKYQYDKMYYVVGLAQDHHFRQLFKILELMGKDWVQKMEHIPFGLIKSKDGNMSTRKGSVVFLQDILDHVKEEMHTVMKKNEVKYAQIQDPELISDTVGISSIMVQDMGARRGKDYQFDWNRMLSFEGDTGPYLQYAHSRLCSIERQAIAETGLVVNPENIDEIDFSVLTEPQAQHLLAVVLGYPDVIKGMVVSGSLEPCTLIGYIWTLTHAVSSSYDILWVHGKPKELALPRLALYGAARIALGNALCILGLTPVTRM